MRRRCRQVALSVGLVAVVSSSASADVGDVLAIITHVPTQPGLWPTLRLVASLMLVNYGVNLVVIGVPLAIIRPIRLWHVLLPVAWLTVVLQLVDRIAVLIFFVLAVIVPGLSTSETLLTSALFVFTGVILGAVVYGFLRWQSRLGGRASAAVGTAAGVVSNPLWGFIALGMVSA